MVQKLDLILLTDQELLEVRDILKNIPIDKQNREENIRLFESLFKTWAHNTISTITLSLLAQQYELAYNLILTFAEGEVDIEVLTQIAKLVQLIESPIFVCKILY